MHSNLIVIRIFHIRLELKKNHFSAVFGIEKESYLDVVPRGKSQPQRVLIERGNVLFVRNDIPHRGCENLSDYTNHRIHILIAPANL